jgi:hypothetical protein
MEKITALENITQFNLFDIENSANTLADLRVKHSRSRIFLMNLLLNTKTRNIHQYQYLKDEFKI